MTLGSRSRRALRMLLILAAGTLDPGGRLYASTPASTFTVKEVAPGIYVHAGRHVGLDDPARSDIANIGFIVGKRCVAVVDTGGSIAVGRALRAALAGVTDEPVCYVINTHVHFDHVLGNAAFVQEGTVFVGHERLAEAIEANRAYFQDRFAAELRDEQTPGLIVGPERLVSDTLELDLGDRVLELTAHPSAHTTQDLSVFDRNTGVAWLGDLVFMERIPALDGSIRGWHAVLEKLQAQHFSAVVPGHGPAIAPWPAAAAAEMQYLTQVLTEVRSAIAEGVFLEDAVATVARSQRDKWRLFDENHGRNVSRAYKELEWE